MKGWVYVISNKAMPGILKVGYTMKDPQLRANELYHTGAPHQYEVDYEALVDNPYNVEQSAHLTLIKSQEGKEWFRCSLEEAISAIRKNAQTMHLENLKRFDREQIENAINEKKRAQAELQEKLDQFHQFKGEIERSRSAVMAEYERKRKALLSSRRDEFIPIYILCMVVFTVLFLVIFSFAVSLFFAFIASFFAAIYWQSTQDNGTLKSPEYNQLAVERDKQLLNLTYTLSAKKEALGIKN